MDLQKKRTSTLILSARSRQGSVSKKICSTSCTKCIFCRHQQTTKDQQTYFPTMINKALYTKYSSSQNYYYTRGFNEFLTNARTPNVIKFKDTLLFEEEEEYLKRFYRQSEYPAKIEMLTEYYKFHKDIARMFMLPSTNTVNRYHDKKRRLEYIRVTKMLREQNQNQGHNKNPVQEMKKADRIRNIPITDRVLDDLELTKTDTQGINRRMVTELSDKITPGNPKKKTANKENNTKETKKNKGIQEVKVNKDIRGGVSSPKNKIKQDKTIEHSRDLSISQTIQELNWKLGEIISTSHSQNNLDIFSYFENSEQQSNETISNLQNFLEYIQVNPQNATKLSRIPAISSSEQQSQAVKSLPNTYRSPDSDLKSTSNSKASLKINPYINQVSNNHKQFMPESNLANELLRRVSLDHPIKASKKMITTEDSTKHPEFERPLTTLTSSRASVHPTPSANATKSKNKPPVSIKIQNFEEALKRQPTSPRQLNSQNSTSRERVCSKFSGSLSHRTNDIKSLKFNQDVNTRGVLTSRRESQTNSNLLKTSHKATSKDKANFQNVLEKNGDPSVHTSQNLTTRPSSHRDMRISLDMYPINRHMSQPEGIESTVTTYTNNTGSTYVKVRSSKPKPSMSGVQKGKDIKHLSTLGQMDLQDKDIRSVPTSACQKQGLRSHLTSRGEYRSSNRIEIIPEQDKHGAQRKALTHRETNAMTGHKYNKSEVKFGKLEAAAALMKKSSLPQSVVSRDAEQVLYDERRYTKDREASPSKQGYTYNHNNIVNIFVQSRPETVSNNMIQGSKEDLKRLGFGKSRKSDAFENMSKHVSGRESPSLISKKEEVTSAKIKNIYRSSIGSAITTYAKPTLPTRTKGKVELDLMEKRIKVNDDNHYEILLKFKGK